MSTKPFHISMLVPLNRDQEREKFFFDAKYNPQFVYEDSIHQTDIDQYGRVSDEHMHGAKNILDSVIKRWGTESAFLAEAEGRLLTREEVSTQIRAYLKKHELDQQVTVRFTHNVISRTSIDGYVMNVRLPIDYRELSFTGVLDHEIGTHVLRRVNDKHQPWRGHRDTYHLRPYLETEEGIASLHNHLSMKEKHMWTKALLYYAASLASVLSFSELNEALKPYVDTKERRWSVCLRVKRGIMDTSVPAVFPKDQIYLRGVIKVLGWLEEHDYDITSLYLGKIALEDVKKVMRLTPDFVPRLPAVFTENKEWYKEMIVACKKANGF